MSLPDPTAVDHFENTRVLLVGAFDDAMHAHTALRRRALERLGCRVTSFNLVSQGGLLNRLRRIGLYDRMAKALRHTDPEVVLVLEGSQVPPELVAELKRTLPCRVLYDWGGGLVWIAANDTGDSAGTMVVREAVARVGGHATLVRAPDHVRVAVEVFEPQPAPVMDLQRRLKAAFDPEGILNPGKLGL